MVTHADRSSIVTCLFNMAVVKKKEDSTDELCSHRINKDNQDTQKVIKYVEKTLNPFQMSAD